MKSKASLILIALFGLAFQGQEKAPLLDSIRKEAMRPEIFFLAGDAMQGRLTDTPGNFIAEEYIKSRFEAIGLKPAGSVNSYFHNFNLMTATLGEGNVLEVKAPTSPILRLEPGQDYYPHFYSASGQAAGRIVFVGFGMVMPDLSYDDYQGKDLNGAIALVLNDEPGERDPQSPFDGLVRTEASSPLRKVLFAQEKGAAAVLFVRDVHNHPEGPTSRQRPGATGRPSLLASHATHWRPGRIRFASRRREISPALAAILLRHSNKSLMELCQAAETGSGLGPVSVGTVEVSLTAGIQRHLISERNVVGMIEGSDPKLKDESIIICSHHDHNGADGQQIYAGADDAISGTAGTIAIAEACAQAARAGQRPRRSIIFASWEAEERGLLGAWAYAEDPFLPRDKIVAVLNLDMIGRNEEVPEGGESRFRGLEIQTGESNRNAVNILGAVRCPDLRTQAERANKAIGLELRFRYDNNASNLLRRSDHWPFIQFGVPAVWIFTGLHPDYHTIYDRPEEINYVKLERIVRMVHQLSWDLAQQEARLKLLPRAR